MTNPNRVPTTIAIWLIAVLATTPALAQTRLTLADALRLAADHSEALDASRAAEARTGADLERVRSQQLPQLNFTGVYSRTLASEFSSAFGDTSGPVCSRFTANPSAPVGDRLAELERAGACGGWGSSFNFAELPFGQKNNYQLGFTLAQPLYTGGRVAAARRQAQSFSQAARLTTTATAAQLQFDVARAYYDAALADRLVMIAEQVFAQSSANYDQTRLAFEAGRQPEFELLRAQVNRDNQRPALIRRRADREVAYLRLRQLLELPGQAPLSLDVDLEAAVLAPPAPFAGELSRVTADPSISRVTVDQSQAFVNAREAALSAASAERRPTVTLSSSYAGVGYPSGNFLPEPSDFRTNASVSMTVNVPIFTGFRVRADERAARADLTQAKAELKQTQELAVLDAATAREDLVSAEAAWEASAGTIQQAERAYQIAELRNREGLSTQLELSDSRLSLEVAQANRAQAARDLQVARVRVALLPSLPMATR
jgi:outer membrane protein TolC